MEGKVLKTVVPAAALAAAFAAAAHAQIDLRGTVTSADGEALRNVAIVLLGRNLFDSTDASGKYGLTLSSPAAGVRGGGVLTPRAVGLRIRGNRLSFGLPATMPVRIRVFDMSGRLVGEPVHSPLGPGRHSFPLFPLTWVDGVFTIKATFGNRTMEYSYLTFGEVQMATGGTRFSQPRPAKARAAAVDTIMASKAGFRTKKVPVSTYSGTYDITLDTIPTTTGVSGQEDGSALRVERYGEAQVFGGVSDQGDTVPFVKIIHAETDDAVDVVLMFSPHFVDITYGTGSIGWGNRGHTFKDLERSDHVEVDLRNDKGTTVFKGKLDLISASADASSGYASLGPVGGDGTIETGSADDILSYGSSMDDNLNYYGYDMLENSPATDSVYTVNPDYPNWEYYAIYRLSLKPEAFGSSGYGSANMTYVHASPAKTGSDTYEVFEIPEPPPGSETDVFRYRHTYRDELDNPPGDGGDDTTPPPDDGSSTDAPPPDDGSSSDDTTDPPTDDTDTDSTGSMPSDSTETGDDTTPPPDDGSDTDVPPPGDGSSTDSTDAPPSDGTDTLPVVGE